MNKNTVHLYLNPLLAPKEIAPLILSSRKAPSGVGVRTAERVLGFLETHHHVEDLLRAPPGLKMPQAHIDMLIGGVTRTPWLYLDGDSEGLDKRCRVKYLPGYCWAMPKRRGY